MNAALLLASLLAPAQAEAPSALLPREGSSTRWDWRHCTRLSADAQLRSRPLSMDFESVVQKAFQDCDPLFKKVARTQSPDDLERMKEEQTGLIKLDVEMFYFDRATGLI
jgi:hypothetical protein